MKKTLLAVSIAALLGGCGSNPTDRGISGAGIGAGAGAVVGAITGLSVAEGALIGAAAGGLTGALTNKSQVNLGEPAWKQQAGAQPAAAPAPAASTRQPGNGYYADAATVRAVQGQLQRLGLYRGRIDGVAGPQTQAAVRAYQQQNGLLVDGRASSELLAHMNQRAVADRASW